MRTEAELYTLVSECDPAMCLRELAQLAHAIQGFACDTILETGVHAGGSLLVWRRLFNPGMLIGIDSDSMALKAGILCDAKIFAPCLSQSIETIENVEWFLGDREINLFVIDGGHKAHEVQEDFYDYTAFMRPGGLVVFHDIYAPITDECQVPVFWEQVKVLHSHREFYLPDAPGSTGIGLLFLDSYEPFPSPMIDSFGVSSDAVRERIKELQV